jgi:hypothetical protein
MAEVKISELTSATTPLAGTEVVPIVQGGVTKKVEVSNFGGGGAGLKGVHTLVPLQSGKYTYNQAGAGNVSNGAVPANNILSHAYIPNYSYNCSELSLYVNTGAVGGLGRIGVYDDNNGSPNNLIYQSSDIDCSTSGYKVLVTNIDFVEGQVYWIAAHWNLSTINVRLIPTTGFIVLNTETVQTSARYNYGLTYVFGTGLPNPMVGQLTSFNATIPFLSMKKS